METPQPTASMPFWRIVRRAVEAIFAATMLVLLSEVHIGIFRTTLSYFGLRSDVPAIMRIEDGIGRPPILTSPFARIEEAKENPGARIGTLDVSSARIQVSTTAPAKGKALLIVNGLPNQLNASFHQTLSVEDIALREGVNSISVLSEYDRPHYPFGTMAQMFSMLGYEQEFQADHLVVRRPTSSITPSPNLFREPTGHFVFQVWPDEPPLTLPSGFVSIDMVGADGLGLARISPSLSSDHVAQEAPTLQTERQVKISRGAEGIVNVSGHWCYPESSALVRWARAGEILGPELVARSTGVEVFARIDFSDPRWTRSAMIAALRVGVVAGSPGLACLDTSYAVPEADVRLDFHGNFLRLPGDKLELSGFSPESYTVSGPQPMVVGGSLQWTGPTEDRLGLTVFADIGRSGVLGQIPAPPAGPEREQRPSGLLAALSQLSNGIPPPIQEALGLLIPVAPIALLLVALRRKVRHDQLLDRLEGEQKTTALVSLLLLMAAFVVVPIALWIFRVAFDNFGLAHSLIDVGTRSYSFNQAVAAPVVVAAALLVGALVSGSGQGGSATGVLKRSAAALTTIILVVAGFIVLNAMRSDVVDSTLRTDWIGQPQSQPGSSWLTPTVFVVAWLSVSLTLFWAPIYWLASAAARQGRLFWPSVVAAFVIFLAPLLPPIADAASLAIEVASDQFSEPSRPLAWAAPVIAATVMAAVVYACLHGLKTAGITLLPATAAQFVRQRSGVWVVIGLAILFAFPYALQFREPGTGPIGSLVPVVIALQSFGPVVALAFPIGMAIEQDLRVKKSPVEERWSLSTPERVILAATFAGYLSLWSYSPVIAFLQAGIGWGAFFLALGPDTKFREFGLGEISMRLLRYRREAQMLESRTALNEKKFAQAELTQPDLLAERASVEAMSVQALADLKSSPEEAKRQLLEFGPGNSPLENGIRGATGALVAVVVLDVLFSNLSGSESPFALLFHLSFNVVQQTAAGSLGAVIDSLNAGLPIVLMGFLFGFGFHLIRGDDGFTKAAVVSVALLAPFALQISTQPDPSFEKFAALSPFVLSLLAIGAFVFDGAVLRRAEVPLLQWPRIYGFSRSIGYASLAGLVAGAQSLNMLFGELVKFIPHP